jgi:HAMP domain-containing protein/HPt (histidine-containing phosphotransfer) domain-containing protein
MLGWQKLRKSVLFKMVARSVAMIIVTLGLVELISYRLSSQQITDLTLAQMVVLTKNYRAEYDRVVRSLRSEISLLSDLPANYNYFKNREFDLAEEAGQSLDEVNVFFREVMNRSEWATSVRLLDIHGRVITELHRGDAHPDFPIPVVDRDRLANHKVLDSGIVQDRKSGSYAMSFQRSVNDESAPVGLVEVLYDLDGFTAKLRQEKIFDTGHLAVIDSTGKAIAMPSVKTGESVNSVLLEGIRHVSRGEQTQFDYITDRNFLVSAQKMESKDWYVASIVPRDEMFAVLLRLRDIVIGIVCLNVVIELLFLTFFVKKIVTEPVQKIVRYAEKITAGDYDLQISPVSSDEIGTLARRFDEMRGAIRDKIGIIEKHRSELETKVSERTYELQAKSQEIQLVIDSLHQGILVVASDLRVDKQYSMHLKTILETDSIVGEDPCALLLNNSSLSESACEQARAAIALVMGDGEINFRLNANFLPRELVKTVNGTKKTIELDWVPLVNEARVVERIMIIVRDVTELREIIATAEHSKEQLGTLGSMVMAGRQVMQSFFSQTSAYLDAIELCFNKTKMPRAEFVAEVFQSLHTIKGNARMIGLLRLVESAHSAEDCLDAIRAEASDSPERREKLRSAVGALRAVSAQMRELFERTIFDDRATFANEKFLAAFDALLAKLQSGQIEDVQGFAREIATERERSKSHSLASIVRRPVSALASIAQEIGKPAPVLLIEGGDVMLSGNASELLADAVVHLLRNSIDHGIELSADRALAGKAPEGKIVVRADACVPGETLTFHFEDDGGGLDLVAIAKKAGQAGISWSSDEELAEVIFSGGISTARKITELAGRGVGMSAVRSLIAKAGGHIRIELLGPANAVTGRRPFRFKIELPTGAVFHATNLHLISAA